MNVRTALPPFNLLCWGHLYLQALPRHRVLAAGILSVHGWTLHCSILALKSFEPPQLDNNICDIPPDTLLLPWGHLETMRWSGPILRTLTSLLCDGIITKQHCFFCSIQTTVRTSQVAPVIKNTPANAGDIRDVGWIPGSGRSPGGGHGNPLQYACLENPMDREAWQVMVHRVSESDMTEATAHSTQEKQEGKERPG